MRSLGPANGQSDAIPDEQQPTACLGNAVVFGTQNTPFGPIAEIVQSRQNCLDDRPAACRGDAGHVLDDHPAGIQAIDHRRYSRNR